MGVSLNHGYRRMVTKTEQKKLRVGAILGRSGSLSPFGDLNQVIAKLSLHRSVDGPQFGRKDDLVKLLDHLAWPKRPQGSPGSTGRAGRKFLCNLCKVGS